jgi:hypothetical protein
MMLGYTHHKERIMGTGKDYEPVKENDVLISWECPECGDIFDYFPKWHEENGTPSCCDVDMKYKGTLVNRAILK